MVSQRTMRLFVCLYMGYTVTTFIRKSVSFASPALMKSQHLSKSDFGFILSSQMLGYSLGKLVGGVMVDLFSPSLVFTSSLVLVALSAFTFTVFDNVTMFAFCWFLNGVAQGPTWPACALLLKRWFSPAQLGTWWSFLSTSMNVSGTAGPFVTALLLELYDWRFTLNIAGTCAIAVAGISFLFLSDNPPANQVPAAQKDKSKKAVISRAEWRRGVMNLLTQPVFVAICLNYLLVSVVRGACNDWGHLYLIQDKHHSPLTGSSFTSSQEFGGIVGAISAGSLSDFLISKKITHFNPRLLVVFICTIFQSSSIFLFMTTISSTSSTLLISAVGFCLGFGMYGCIALFGVLAMESGVSRLAGTAHSIVALAANVGLMLSGYPLSLVARHHGWHTVFFLVQTVATLTTAVAFFTVYGSSKKTPVKAAHRR